MRRLNLLVCGLVFLTVFSLFGTGIQSSSLDFAVIATVDDAYYCCLEEDCFEDDIVFEMSVFLPYFRWYDAWWGYELDVFVGLTLPSGTEYWYRVSLIAYTDFFFMDFQWFNYATESGWYTAHSIGVGSDQRANDYIVEYMLDFDPPGKIPGAKPTVAVVIY